MTDSKTKKIKKLTLKNEALYYEAHYAVKNANYKRLEELRNNPHYDLKNLDLTTRNCNVMLTEVAIEQKNIMMLDYLLEHGANLHAENTHIHWNLLMYAISSNNLDMAQHLIDKGFNVNTLTSNDNMNALSICVGKYDMIDLLIKAGIDLNHKPNGKISFLQCWVDDGKNWDCIRYTILKGACTDGLYVPFIRQTETFKEFVNQANIEYEKNQLEQVLSDNPVVVKKQNKI
jgi:ankyrin repeat protein